MINGLHYWHIMLIDGNISNVTGYIYVIRRHICLFEWRVYSASVLALFHCSNYVKLCI